MRWTCDYVTSSILWVVVRTLFLQRKTTYSGTQYESHPLSSSESDVHAYPALKSWFDLLRPQLFLGRNFLKLLFWQSWRNVAQRPIWLMTSNRALNAYGVLVHLARSCTRRFVLADHRLYLDKIKHWAGWSEGESSTTVIRYLLEEVWEYELSWNHSMSPCRHDFRAVSCARVPYKDQSLQRLFNDNLPIPRM